MRLGSKWAFGAVGLALMSAAGCERHSHVAVVDDHRPMRAVSQLDCPDQEGRLHRTSAASDGASCQYQSDTGGEVVTLSLMPLNGSTPTQVLAPVEADLKTYAGPGASGSTPTVAVDAASRPGDDHAKIDLPGFHLDASGNKADIRMPGVDIHADGDNAKVNAGWGGRRDATVDAHAGGAVVRAGDVAADGSADLVLVLASDAPGKAGDKAVGYIAKGPPGGPLVVATFRAREGDHGHTDDDVSRLVDLNVPRLNRSGAGPARQAAATSVTL